MKKLYPKSIRMNCSKCGFMQEDLNLLSSPIKSEPSLGLKKDSTAPMRTETILRKKKKTDSRIDTLF